MATAKVHSKLEALQFSQALPLSVIMDQQRDPWTSSVIHGPLGVLLEIQSLRPHPDLLIPNLHFDKIPK